MTSRRAVSPTAFRNDGPAPAADDHEARKGCGCLAGAIGGGCGCLVVIVILLIAGIFGANYWIQSHIQREPESITHIASQIVEEPVPDAYVPRFGFDSPFLRFSVFIVKDIPTVRAMAVVMDTPSTEISSFDLKAMFEAYYGLIARTNTPSIIVRIVEPDGTVTGPPPAEPTAEGAQPPPQTGVRIVSLYQMILPRGDRTILAYYFLSGDAELTGEGRAFFRMAAE